jgi:multimeric flavodoxin WrbA
LQFAEVIGKTMDCNGLILGTPSYWSNLSGRMKNFIDRMLALTYNRGGCEASLRLKSGKKAMLYVVAGVSYRVSSFEGIHYLPFETMNIFMRAANIQVVDYLAAAEVEKAGDIFYQPEILKKAYSQGVEFANLLKK